MLTIALIGIYFAPSVIASAMGSRQLPMILAINTVLGWTIIGWFISLIMAFMR